MRPLRRPLRWLERGEFFGGCASMERQGEAFVVVPGLPVPNGGRGCLKSGKRCRPQNSSWSIRWLRSTLPFCCGRRGRLYRWRIPAASTPSTKANENSWPWSHCSRLMGKGKARWSSRGMRGSTHDAAVDRVAARGSAYSRPGRCTETPGGPRSLPPPPNRPGTDSIVPPRGSWPVRPRILEDDQAMAHPRPILRPNLHVAELDHWPPLVWTPSFGCPSKQRRSILSRYFTG